MFLRAKLRLFEKKTERMHEKLLKMFNFAPEIRNRNIYDHTKHLKGAP